MLTKNVVKLEMYYRPWKLERAVVRFVDHYNHRRRHAASPLSSPPALRVVLRLR